MTQPASTTTSSRMPGARPGLRRIRVPLLVDVVLVDHLDDITELNANPQLTRVVQRGGPLLNRVLSRRVARAFAIGTAPLPTFTDRTDAGRASRQHLLETRLTQQASSQGVQASELPALRDYVQGRGDAATVGVAVQGILGRLFDPGYRATSRTYDAAKVVTQFPRALPPRSWWWRLSGTLARSQAVLAQTAQGDPAAIHAVTNTVHNVVETLTRMRALATDDRSRMTPERAVAQCLAAPPALLRWCAAPTRIAGLAKPLRPGTLVLLRLGKAHDEVHDAASPFLVGAWNQCPAHRYVTALLERVWAAARG